MSAVGVVDTRFRTAIERLEAAGRLMRVRSRVSSDLEAAAILKKCDGDKAVLFERVDDYSVPVIANVLASPANVLTIFQLDGWGVRACMRRAIEVPIKPRLVESGPCQEVVVREGIDLEAMLPVLRHTAGDGGKFITGGIVIAKDPDTGVRNASFHRMQLLGPDRTAIKLDDGRHLGVLYEKARQRGEPLDIAVTLGPDVSVFYAAVSSGAQVPLQADELDLASGLRGEPLDLVRCRTVDVEVPAETEIVIEGKILPDEVKEDEGPFIEFVQIYSEVGPSPVVQVTAITHRRQPLYYACLAGVHGAMLRKYIDEEGTLRALQRAVPIVTDINLTPASIAKFHMIMAVDKRSSRDDGLQRNAILAAFGILKDLDLVIVVDNDIDIHDLADVEYALSMRFDAARDLLLWPDAKTHEYVRASRHGLRTKLGIDATVPFAKRDHYRRAQFAQVDLAQYDIVVGQPIEAIRHP